MTSETLMNQLDALGYTQEEKARIQGFGGLSTVLSTLFDSEQVFYIWPTFMSDGSLLATAIRDDILIVTNKRIVIVKKGWLGTLVEEHALKKTHSITIENNSRIVIIPSSMSAPIRYVLKNKEHINRLKELLYDYI